MALITTKAAAELLCVGESTLRTWRMEHQGPPFYRLSPRKVLYDEREIEAYLKTKRHDPSVIESLTDFTNTKTK